jgi:hypothetical protein
MARAVPTGAGSRIQKLVRSFTRKYFAFCAVDFGWASV